MEILQSNIQISQNDDPHQVQLTQNHQTLSRFI